MEDRNAVFTFSDFRDTKTLTITQKGKDALTVTASKIEIESEGGEVVIEVRANTDYFYKISDDCNDWITAVHDTRARAVTTTQIKLNVASNTEPKERQGVVTISNGEISEEVTIIQSAAKPYIAVEQAEYEVSKDGGIIEVNILNNVDYRIEIEADWVKEISKDSTAANIKYFEISENPLTESRNTQIKIMSNTNEDVYAIVYITQQASSYIDINVSQKGTLSEVLAKNNLNVDDIVLLRISGVLNDVDFIYIRNMSKLKNLDISEVNITELPSRVFYESKIENIVLPKSLKTISEDAFYKSNLNSVLIQNNVIEIGISAFAYTKLQSVNIPASVGYIRSSAFAHCSSLIYVTFENKTALYSIESYAFSGCGLLTSIVIPANVYTIGTGAFQDCTNMTSVTFEKGARLKNIYGSYQGFVNNPEGIYYGTFANFKLYRDSSEC